MDHEPSGLRPQVPKHRQAPVGDRYLPTISSAHLDYNGASRDYSRETNKMERLQHID
jgi:hypothetical protein